MSPVDDLNDVRDEIGTLKIEVSNLRGDLREGLSDIKGSTANIATSVDHVQRELEQRLTFHGEMLKQHNDNLSALNATVNTNRERASLDASAVRVALESDIDRVDLRVTALETWQAGVRGSWKAVAILSSVLSSVIVGAAVAFITYAINH